MDYITTIQNFFTWVLPVLFAITLHEVAHGWVASKLGDNTALLLGRLSLNPIKHIDIFGTIIVPTLLFIAGGFIFGWAKPVPVNWRNLRRPRLDVALVSLAGPMSNLIMAILWALIAKLGVIALPYQLPGAIALHSIGEAGILINLMLMLLNLLPIPPLDGSRVLAAALPKPVAYHFGRLEPFGFFILLGLIWFGVLKLILIPPLIFSYAWFLKIFNLTLIY